MSDEIERLRAEMLDWAEGRRSHTNEFMAVENGSEHRVETLRDVAVADAAEVQKLSAAIVALVATPCPEAPPDASWVTR